MLNRQDIACISQHDDGWTDPESNNQARWLSLANYVLGRTDLGAAEAEAHAAAQRVKTALEG